MFIYFHNTSKQLHNKNINLFQCFPSPAACLRRDASHVDGACLCLRSCRSCRCCRRCRRSCSLKVRRNTSKGRKTCLVHRHVYYIYVFIKYVYCSLYVCTMRTYISISYIYIVGGFNPPEKCDSQNGESSPSR